MRKIIIQGVRGCYHEIAAKSYYQDSPLTFIESNSFPQMFEKLEADHSAQAIMAIENTIAGNLLQNHELLRQSDLRVIGEHRIRISHTLCALPGSRLEDLEEVHSHPIALMQCQDFLHQHPHIKVVETEDTALSAKRIHDTQRPKVAAICGSYAANLYQLETLAESIETNKRNFTRFLILSRDEYVSQDLINKSSIVFSVSHTEGSLSKVLTILSFYQINLTKIQSMPILGKEWEYRFYIDLTFDDYAKYSNGLNAILPFTKDFKILGEYAESK